MMFKNETELIAGGYDYNPAIFKEKGGKWYGVLDLVVNLFTGSSKIL